MEKPINKELDILLDILIEVNSARIDCNLSPETYSEELEALLGDIEETLNNAITAVNSGNTIYSKYPLKGGVSEMITGNTEATINHLQDLLDTKEEEEKLGKENDELRFEARRAVGVIKRMLNAGAWSVSRGIGKEYLRKLEENK